MTTFYTYLLPTRGKRDADIAAWKARRAECLDDEMGEVDRIMDGDDRTMATACGLGWDGDDADVMQFLQDALVWGHFGMLEGMNDWEHCQAQVILGREELPLHVLESMGHARHGIGPDAMPWLVLPSETKGFEALGKGRDMTGFDEIEGWFSVGDGYISRPKCRTLLHPLARQQLISTTVAGLKQANRLIGVAAVLIDGGLEGFDGLLAGVALENV